MRNAVYESRTLGLETGDVVVIFSDGIPEARDKGGDLYGYDAPRDLLAGLDTSKMTAEKIKNAIVADLQRFCGTNPPGDDITIVVIKVE
jgi:serine phosphatase RsbU (regulator of sigma subunit)